MAASNAKNPINNNNNIYTKTSGEEEQVKKGSMENSVFPNDGFQDFTDEEILKYQKYEANYACRLRAKYFSNKDIYGGDIFDLTVAMGNETIKAGRWSPAQSYADPAQSLEDPVTVMASGSELPSGAKTSQNVANGNTIPQNKTD